MKLCLLKKMLHTDQKQCKRILLLEEPDSVTICRAQKPSCFRCVSVIVLFGMMTSLSMLVAYFTLGKVAGPNGGGVAHSAQAQVLSCYYNTPDSNATAGQLLPSQIDPNLCTHINVAFARIVQKEVYLEQSQWETLREVVKLKQDNPMLKVLLSIGGSGEVNGFSEMVADHASRKVFIKSVKSILKNYTLDGIDLDWEFPALHLLKGDNLFARERQHFSQLLREIRTEYIREKKDYILTVAVAAPQTIVDVAYDVDQINLYVDFANIMTYDFHYYNKFTPFTGLNAPLYARASEELYPATLNVNYTVGMYAAKGLDRDKIVVGIPTYGHTFRLVNANNPGVGSPASGVGALGARGFIDYPEACAFRAHGGATERYDAAARVPYLFRGREWVSYDSARSAAAKARFVRTRRLRGAMLYSLNADDHAGRCGASFPLARAVRRALQPAPAPASASAEIVPFPSS